MSQTDAANSLPSSIAGRFQVMSKLGAGAFGTVFLAKDKVLGRQVAIKTIRLDGIAAAGVSREELVQRFQKEAEVSAQLRHPSIVTVYDVGESEGMSYLAMEFIEGTGLDRVISTTGPLPLERVLSIGIQMAEALDYAHQRGVVHRDIKPANIMVEADDRIKITDFGIAKVLDSGEHLTITGSLLGTPSYMSPEQARGAALDGRSDLFAAGCILYEMLAGKKAFSGETLTAVILKIMTDEPKAIRQLDPAIPESMERIISKALSKAPETRYQSGKELARDLQAVASGAARPAQAPQPSEPTVQETRLSPAQATVVAAAATAAAATPTPQAAAPVAPRPAPAPRPPAPAGAPRSRLGLWIGIGIGAVALVGVAFVGLFSLVLLGGSSSSSKTAGSSRSTHGSSAPSASNLPDDGPEMKVINKFLYTGASREAEAKAALVELLDAQPDLVKASVDNRPILTWTVSGVGGEGDLPHRRQQLAEWLLERGAQIDALDPDGETALLRFSTLARVDEIEFVLSHGANAKATDPEGDTALHRVASMSDKVPAGGGEAGCLRAAKLLLDAKADVNARNNSAATPLAIATQGNHSRMEELLRQHGATE